MSDSTSVSDADALAQPARTSISRRLFGIIFGSYFGISLIVTGIQLGAEYRHTEARIGAEIQSMRQTFGPGIADAMWRFQDDVLRGILAGMNELPVVVGVKVLDQNGVLVRAVGTVIETGEQRMRADADGHLTPITKESGLFHHTFGQEFPVVYTDENGRERNIGTWFVYSDRSVIMEQVQHEFFLIFISAIIKATALWFIFLYVVQRWLGKPLNQLSEFVRNLNIDNLGAQTFVVRGQGRDELHFLADSLNSATSRLRQSIERNTQLYRELEHDRQTLHDLNDTLEQRVIARTEELQKANLLLADLSMTDGLTGIANRRRFAEVLESEWTRAMRSGQSLALAMIDVDWFKRYNDHYGHQAGDDCLRAVARLLTESTRRGGDLVARYGGEEFAIIAPATDGAQALQMAHAICQAIQSLALPHALSEFSHVSVSIGVTALVPGQDDTPDALLRLADAALYRAKGEGRNRVVCDPTPPRRVVFEPALVELAWKDGFECGHAPIDLQHRNLFRVANELLAQVLAHGSADETGILIERLLTDVAQHFSDEEEILRQLGFADLEQHAAEHARLLGRGRELLQEFQAQTLSIGNLFQFLAYEVIVRHILGADREYQALIRGRHC